ncbi:LacI family DNA-binding transcriptional regulator [Alphaproteobacteria bacterium]|jgi:DNA-binding LacI/PurR family transcriptional regulator|nr:LacI family DNA-binding transcriptional regulator [Alphaproteobacteria bacterium]
MPREISTSLDVARRAGVSQSAVSRVFTPGASASKATAEKVRKAAEDLGYRPNSLARAMVSGRTRIIGLVVAYLQNQFYPDALERLSAKLQRQGYHVLVFLTANTKGEIEDVVEEILDYQVDGIIAASVAMSSELSKRCNAIGVPMVLFNRSQNDASISSVTSNNISGGRKIAEFLLAGGHKRIGYIAGWEGASTQRDRERGFVEALARAGVEIHSHAAGNFQSSEAREAALTMFSAETRPDAVFVANDHMALAVMDVLRFELGLRVPEDVSVVGYDDVPAAAWPAYSLTTVRQPAQRMVDETVDILLAQIDGETMTPRSIEIDGPLIVRGSARKPEECDDERF